MECYYNVLTDIKKICTAPPDIVRISKGKFAMSYIQYHCGFDIETTNVVEGENRLAFMYHWQFGINTHVIYGRTWAQFVEFLARLEAQLKLSPHLHLIIWVANLGFEFQFMRRYLNITQVFARTKREPFMVEHNNRIEFRDCLPISGGNLDYLAKHYTNVKKAKGDLNFNIARNSHTELTEKELNYCRMDVKPLVEWSKYIFNTFVIPQKYIPMTKTGILRHTIKEGVTKEIKGYVRRAFPSQTLYNVMMKWLFRGGYTHANMWWVNRKITQPVNGYDFTSSYPAVMQQYDRFPMSKFKRIPTIKTEKDLEKIPPACPYFIAVRFTNIRATTYHSIESEYKCVKLVGKRILSDGKIEGEPIIDNGRVRKAGIMSVFITDVDLAIYRLFYEWDKMEISACYYCAGGHLPEYLLKPLADLYYTKARLKKSGQEETTEYVESKKAINSGYGMTTTKVYTSDIKYDQEHIDEKTGLLSEWLEIDSNKPWWKIVQSQFLLPQWGIWITAIARYRLLKTVYVIDQESNEGGDSIYCDTDSVYLTNIEKHQHIIDDYNAEIYAINDRLFPNMPEFHDLGEFDKINKAAKSYYAFKTLGAKRYIKTQKLIVNNRVYDAAGDTSVTIAGLPKKALQKYCKEKHTDIYETFANGMTMDFLYSQKNAHHYNDIPTEWEIEGERMTELSSVCIYPTTFKLSWADIYEKLLEEVKERREEIEKY